MVSDVLAVMNTLHLEKVGLVGWSDGAVIALMLARQVPERVVGVFFFACNMDPNGTKEFEFTPIIQRCFGRHSQNYQQLQDTYETYRYTYNPL